MEYNKDLITFISEKAGINEREISYASLIENDLGITGEDAAELIMEFSKLFKIDIMNFNFDRYFHREPSVFLNENGKFKKPLNVGHLAKAIAVKFLDDVVIDD